MNLLQTHRLVLLLALFLIGCPENGENPTPDAGSDAAPLDTSPVDDTSSPGPDTATADAADTSTDTDPIGDADGGETSCTVPCGVCGLGAASCSEGDRCDHPLEATPPVGDFERLDCRSQLIFVDDGYTGVTPDGTREAPFPKLETALQAAESRGAKAVVIGGSPLLIEIIDVRNGVSIYGGFDGYPTFRHNPAERPRLQVERSSVEKGALVALIARDISERTVVSGLTIDNWNLDGESDVSNIGAFLDRAPALIFDRMQIHAGHAGHGSDGADGRDSKVAGADGAAGQEMAHLHQKTCPDSIAIAKGGAGASPKGQCEFLSKVTVLARGGDGGAGSEFLSQDPGEDSLSGTEGGRDRDGDDGAALERADDGSNGGLVLRVEAEGRPRATGYGGAGRHGRPGHGGAGGSSGPDHYRTIQGTDNVDCFFGAGGGGGGAGGCGGEGGRGGEAGGWSVGIAAANSDGFSVRNTRIRTGDGGDGGAGGLGGEGAPGGTGGKGGEGTQRMTRSGNTIDFTGFDGGDGGAGQHGGHGANGTGGASVGIWCDEGTGIDLRIGTDAFELGNPGAGGTSDKTGLPAGRPGQSSPTNGCG